MMCKEHITTSNFINVPPSCPNRNVNDFGEGKGMLQRGAGAMGAGLFGDYKNSAVY